MRFILVDEILALEKGKTIEAVKVLPEDEELFLDHFPGFPVIPGVLLVEMMAQTAGKCVYSEDPDRGRPMLAKIKNANFRDWVRPGDVNHIFAEISSSQSSFALAKCKIEVKKKVVAQAELLIAFASNDLFEAEYRDQILEKFYHN